MKRDEPWLFFASKLPLLLMVLFLVWLLFRTHRREQEWRELAYAGVDQAKACSQRLTEQIVHCTEDIVERQNRTRKLVEAYCACPNGVHVLEEHLDGGYTCRCRR